MDHPGRQGGMISADLEASKNCIQVPAKPDKANICMEMLNLGDATRWSFRWSLVFLRDPFKKVALYNWVGFLIPQQIPENMMVCHNPSNPSWLLNRDPYMMVHYDWVGFHPQPIP